MIFKARILVLALAFTVIASSLSPGVAAAAAHHHAHHDDRASYPMPADEFRKLMEKRIDAVRAAIDRKLERRGVSPDRKKAIHKIFDEASKDLRAEIARAAAGKTVTHADAEKAKTLASGLRARVRERLRAEKSPKLKEKLARQEAAKKDHAGHDRGKGSKPSHGDDEDGPSRSPAHASHDAGHDAAHDAGKPSPSPAQGAHKKSAPADAEKAAPAKARGGHTKATGPTRTANAPATKKRKHAKVDPGSRL